MNAEDGAETALVKVLKEMDEPAVGAGKKSHKNHSL